MASGVLNLGKPGGVGILSGGPWMGTFGRASMVLFCEERDDFDDESGGEGIGAGISETENDFL